MSKRKARRHYLKIERAVEALSPDVWRIVRLSLRRWLREALAASRDVYERLVLTRAVDTQDISILAAQIIQAGALSSPPDPAGIADLVADHLIERLFIGADPRADAMRVYLNDVLIQRVTSIWTNITSPEYLAKNLLELKAEGLTYTQAANKVAAKYDKQYYVAERLVRTTSNSGFNYGDYVTKLEDGVEFHSWLSAQDKRVRRPPKSAANHAEMNGQTVKVGEPFITTRGFRLLFPCDASLGAPADEVINCRCTTVDEILSDEDTNRPRPAPVLPEPENPVEQIPQPTAEDAPRRLTLADFERDVIGKLEATSLQIDELQASQSVITKKLLTPLDLDEIPSLLDESGAINKKIAKLKNGMTETASAYLLSKPRPLPYRIVGVAKADLPRALVDESLDWFERAIRSDLPIGQIEIRKNRGRRAYASGNEIHMTPRNPTKTYIHEMGHVLERDPELVAKSKAFVQRRTAGEPEVRLKDLFKGYGYSASEKTKPDQFIHPYIGKTYSRATEVVSMGLEYMYDDPLMFYKRDKDHFNFILELLGD